MKLEVILSCNNYQNSEITITTAVSKRPLAVECGIPLQSNVEGLGILEASGVIRVY